MSLLTVYNKIPEDTPADLIESVIRANCRLFLTGLSFIRKAACEQEANFYDYVGPDEDGYTKLGTGTKTEILQSIAQELSLNFEESEVVISGYWATDLIDLMRDNDEPWVRDGLALLRYTLIQEAGE